MCNDCIHMIQCVRFENFALLIASPWKHGWEVPYLLDEISYCNIVFIDIFKRIIEGKFSIVYGNGIVGAKTFPLSLD